MNKEVDLEPSKQVKTTPPIEISDDRDIIPVNTVQNHLELYI